MKIFSLLCPQYLHPTSLSAPGRRDEEFPPQQPCVRNSEVISQTKTERGRHIFFHVVWRSAQTPPAEQWNGKFNMRITQERRSRVRFYVILWAPSGPLSSLGHPLLESSVLLCAQILTFSWPREVTDRKRGNRERNNALPSRRW